jgi:hypothetical protein
MTFQDVFKNFQCSRMRITLFDIADQIFFDIIYEEIQDLTLALKMPVNGSLRNPDLFGDPSDGDVFTAIFNDQFSQGVYDLFSPQRSALTFYYSARHIYLFSKQRFDLIFLPEIPPKDNSFFTPESEPEKLNWCIFGFISKKAPLSPPAPHRRILVHIEFMLVMGPRRFRQQAIRTFGQAGRFCRNCFSAGRQGGSSRGKEGASSQRRLSRTGGIVNFVRNYSEKARRPPPLRGGQRRILRRGIFTSAVAQDDGTS